MPLISLLSSILSPLFSVFKSTKPAAAPLTHANLFPEMYAHPGYATGKADSIEVDRRCDYLAKLFPQYDRERLKMMAEAGLRAEVRAGASLRMTPEYNCLDVNGPHPKEFVSHAALREDRKALLKLDLMDCFTAIDLAGDWTGMIIGMDTDVRAYRSAIDSGDRCRLLFMESRTLQQVKDDVYDTTLHAFLLFLRVRVFELLLRQRVNRHSVYRMSLHILLKKATAGDNVDLLQVADINYPVLREHINFIFTLVFPDSVLVQASEQTFAPATYLCDRFILNPTPTLAADDPQLSSQPTPPASQTPALKDGTNFPPSLDDPSWKLLRLPTDCESADALTIARPDYDIGLDLILKFLKHPRAHRAMLIRHVGMWKSEPGANALIMMNKLAVGKHDLVDFTAFVCDLKHGRGKAVRCPPSSE